MLRKRQFVTAIGLLSMLGLAICALANAMLHTRPFTCSVITNPSMVDIEAAAIKLPPTAQNVDLDVKDSADCALYLRFEMSSADLPAFKASTRVRSPFSFTPMEKPMAFNAVPERLGWKIDQIPAFLAGYAPMSVDFGHYQQSILIDVSNKTSETVYIVVRYEN
jgi:hypothetical protein